MESSRLPIELCEAVMNALVEYSDFPYRYWFLAPGPDWRAQQALCACALTCRAWRVRAQYLLCTFPVLPDSESLAHFKTAIRKSPNKAIIRGLMLASTNMAGELFMHSFPHLQHLLCFGIRFDRGPPLRLLRMRLPFFSTITTLTLFRCTFESMRAMLDVVWACSNLTTLAIGGIEVKSKRFSAAGLQNLSATAEKLRACRRLTRLSLHGNAMWPLWNLTIIGINGVGRVFGCAITELHFETDCAPGQLLSILTNSFPALHSVTVVCGVLNSLEPPWLHVIAISRPISGMLKTIILEHKHYYEECDCCKAVVGTSKKVPGSGKRLPELLTGLMKLTIRLDGCEDPGRCATYTFSALPGMRDVLWFEYRAPGDDWKLYTLPVAK